MKLLFARFLSYFFHPVLLFLIMPFFVVYRQTDSELYAIKWMLFSSVFILFGVMIILFETLDGDFSDFDISKRQERFKFYLISFLLGIIYLVPALFFKGIFFPLSFITLGITAGLVTLAVISKYTKASVHTAVVCAFVLSIAILYGSATLLVTFWMVPLVAWARITLKKHNWLEVFLGALVGITITILTLSVKNIFFSN